MHGSEIIILTISIIFTTNLNLHSEHGVADILIHPFHSLCSADIYSDFLNNCCLLCPIMPCLKAVQDLGADKGGPVNTSIRKYYLYVVLPGL